MDTTKIDEDLPLFKDRSFLDGYLLHVLGVNECSVVLDLIRFGSPWSLLKIFLQSSFVGDYESRDAKGRRVLFIPNDEICWHLMAIVQALRDKTSDLSPYYGDRFTRPFFFGKGHKNKKGQAKLMFSLLFFCLDVVKRGYSSIYVLGGGEGYGGQNHYNVARILDNMGIKLTMILYDPLLLDAEHEIGGVKIVTKRKSVEGHDQYNYPVYCDIMDNSQWQVLQESVVAPVKMMKYINGPYVPGAFMQPYSHEMRIFDTDILPSVLEGLCHDFEFLDTCVHCMLWRSLCVRYGVSEEDVVAEIVDLNVRPCKRVAGAGLMLNESDSRKTNMFRSHIQRELVKEKKLLPARNEVVLEPTNRDKVLLSYFRDLQLLFIEKVRGVYNLLCKDTSLRADSSENCIVYDIGDIDYSFPSYYYICEPGTVLDDNYFGSRGYMINDVEDLHYCLVYHLQRVFSYSIVSIDFTQHDVKFVRDGSTAHFFGYLENGDNVAIVCDGIESPIIYVPRTVDFLSRVMKLNFNSWLSSFGSKFSLINQFQRDVLYICYSRNYCDVMHDARPVICVKQLCLVIYDDIIRLCDIKLKQKRDHRPGRVRQDFNISNLISFFNLIEKG